MWAEAQSADHTNLGAPGPDSGTWDTTTVGTGTVSRHLLACIFPEIDGRILCVLVDFFEFGFGEVELLDGVERVIKLLDVARADQGGGNSAVAEDPGHGHLRQ